VDQAVDGQIEQPGGDIGQVVHVNLQGGGFEFALPAGYSPISLIIFSTAADNGCKSWVQIQNTCSASTSKYW
jgi:hypothetical protein